MNKNKVIASLMGEFKQSKYSSVDKVQFKGATVEGTAINQNGNLVGFSAKVRNNEVVDVKISAAKKPKRDLLIDRVRYSKLEITKKGIEYLERPMIHRDESEFPMPTIVYAVKTSHNNLGDVSEYASIPISEFEADVCQAVRDGYISLSENV